jgi:hypothetical protein
MHNSSRSATHYTNELHATRYGYMEWSFIHQQHIEGTHIEV